MGANNSIFSRKGETASADLLIARGAAGAKPQAQRIDRKGASGKTGENQRGIFRRIFTTAKPVGGLCAHREADHQSKSKCSKKELHSHFNLLQVFRSRVSVAGRNSRS